jgi:transcriptional regulator with XRE-family HTH domain
LNETFCRALLRAGLTEEDVATRLSVDPKTVRRWIEGRTLPYHRHRWTLAALLGTAETDLWPQLRSAQPRPEEVVAVYPHLGGIPTEVWLRLFGRAQRDISLLDHCELSATRDREILTTLAERARAGVTIQICLAGSDMPGLSPEQRTSAPTSDASSALGRYAPLRATGDVAIRLPRGVLYNFIYRADDELVVAQRAHGIPVGQVPALHLQRADGGDMFSTYVDSFERTWAGARPVN